MAHLADVAGCPGLPVIVTDLGGPQENMIPEKTGLVVPGNDEEALVVALRRLFMDPKRLNSMGIEARRYMEARSFDEAFDRTWRIYEERPIPQARTAAQSA